ncbi:MAG: hypothetical protein O3C40_13690 [Planctomycetota bacterium]|nr:hypothetical protein [Planctomycetota bacterium]
MTLHQFGDSSKPLATNTLDSLPVDRAASGAAVDLDHAPIDPDLQSIIDHWSELSEAVKAGIVAMVRATERK